MTTARRTVARGAILVIAVLAASTLGAGIWSGLSSSNGADSPAGPASCVATILPDSYYQAIAELNACTGSSVIVEMPPPDIRWRIAGNSLPPGTGVSRTDP